MKGNIAKKFFYCGLCGWGFECFWTGLHSMITREKKLPCTTSIWMFPIYGLGSFMSPVCKLVQNFNFMSRGIIYTICIFFTEYETGTILKRHNACPWDYSKSKANYKGVIRFDYAPLWFAVGLIFERMVMKNKR